MLETGRHRLHDERRPQRIVRIARDRPRARRQRVVAQGRRDPSRSAQSTLSGGGGRDEPPRQPAGLHNGLWAARGVCLATNLVLESQIEVVSRPPATALVIDEGQRMSWGVGGLRGRKKPIARQSTSGLPMAPVTGAVPGRSYKGKGTMGETHERPEDRIRTASRPSELTITDLRTATVGWN